jgi:osmotically-inducible protein OsmY
MVAVVALIGRVSSGAIKTDSERIARGTQDVTDVHNELLVGEMKNYA